MSDKIQLVGPVAFLPQSQSAVYFSMNSSVPASGNKSASAAGTCVPIKKLQTALEVAPWGEDNRFPQNIEQQLAYCGVAKSALDFKARALLGNGIVAGRVTGLDTDGKEIFVPIDPKNDKEIHEFLTQRSLQRFFLEYVQDWVWYGNCFPEIIFSYDGKKVTGFVHQESCDARFKQMNDEGVVDTVYLSKLWGAAKDQLVKFDPKKAILGLIENPKVVTKVDGVLVKALDCIDMYDALESAKRIIAKQVKKRKATAMKSAILPVNYPSVNKTYYQLVYWDGARLAGWMEIAAKIPNLYKTLFNQAFSIKYHIEIPESFLEDKYGPEVWKALTEVDQMAKKMELLEDMEKFLSGDGNAHKTFISFFSVDNVTKKEYGQIKITPLKYESNIDKDLILASSAVQEILMSIQVHPTLFSGGMTGNTLKSGGGTDLREAFLMMINMLRTEREVLLEPLYLARDYNGWGSDIVFRIKDVVLTTLDKGAGTERKIS